MERRGPGARSGIEGVELEKDVLDKEVEGRVAPAVLDGDATPFLEECRRVYLTRAPMSKF